VTSATRAGGGTAIAVAVGICAVSSSAPLIAYAAAPALAIAFWRNGFAVAVLVPVAAVRRRAELARVLTSRTGVGCVLAGVALAAHFGTWVPSAKLTTAATATALVATQPVWQGLIAHLQGRRLPRLAWTGIAVAVTGATLTTGADLGVSSTAVAGDLLALAGGVAGAVYVALGERVRATTSTLGYTSICYLVCAALLGGVCAAAGVPLRGYPVSTWLAILALAAGAQLLGHSLFNYALRRIPAATLSVLVLLEVPGAALVAWAWLGQVPRPAVLPGVALLLGGVACVLAAPFRTGRPRPGSPPTAAAPAGGPPTGPPGGAAAGPRSNPR
jgi:drug/metabolite transporter (DMT)-like permease